ncbi:unnamed protein product [Cuscuta campestris]|uniref:Uncharacterized protein n=1 Tax=Cuscuta campestris TaxID=132261 RepID=A0A484KHD4_9ASTE|nr:unnamed protein product [Cuscuta campestris]
MMQTEFDIKVILGLKQAHKDHIPFILHRRLGILAVLVYYDDTMVANNEDSIGDPCLPDYTKVYLNRPEVQKALHINKTHLPYSWDECIGGLKSDGPLKDPYATKNFHTLSRLLTRHIQILLYSGDQDVINPVVETRKLVQILAKDLKLVRLRKNGPWYNGPQIGQIKGVLSKAGEGGYAQYTKLQELES